MLSQVILNKAVLETSENTLFPTKKFRLYICSVYALQFTLCDFKALLFETIKLIYIMFSRRVFIQNSLSPMIKTTEFREALIDKFQKHVQSCVAM